MHWMNVSTLTMGLYRRGRGRRGGLGEVLLSAACNLERRAIANELEM